MSAEEKAERDRKNDEELAAAQAEEKRRQDQRDAEIEAAWSKKVLTEGAGPSAYRGAQARVHIVGRAAVDKDVQGRAKANNFVSGSVFEDSRERQCPVLLLLGRGTLVPGLDRALLTMRVGERAEVSVGPEAGYGLAGSIAHPCVPGSATLTYDVELLSVDLSMVRNRVVEPTRVKPPDRNFKFAGLRNGYAFMFLTVLSTQ